MKRGNILPVWGKRLAIAVVLVTLISCSLALACEKGIWTDKCTYNSNSNVKLSYATPDITNSAHTIKIFKGSDPVVIEKGKANTGDATWNCGSGEGTYKVELWANGTKYASCDIVVRNDNIAPTTTYSFSKSPKSDGSYDTGVKLSFSATDNSGGTGVAAIYYWGITSDCHQTYCSPLAFNTPGTYTVTFKAMDNAGNLEMVNGAFRTLTFTVTAPAPAATEAPHVSQPTANPTAAPTATPTAAPTATPTATPTSTPAPIPTEQPQTITETGYDVSNPMNGTEALFTADGVQPTANPQAPQDNTGDNTGDNAGNNTVVVVGAVSGVTVVAGAALLIFRRL